MDKSHDLLAEWHIDECGEHQAEIGYDRREGKSFGCEGIFMSRLMFVVFEICKFGGVFLVHPEETGDERREEDSVEEPLGKRRKGS